MKTLHCGQLILMPRSYSHPHQMAVPDEGDPSRSGDYEVTPRHSAKNTMGGYNGEGAPLEAEILTQTGLR